MWISEYSDLQQIRLHDTDHLWWMWGDGEGKSLTFPLGYIQFSFWIDLHNFPYKCALIFKNLWANFLSAFSNNKTFSNKKIQNLGDKRTVLQALFKHKIFKLGMGGDISVIPKFGRQENQNFKVSLSYLLRLESTWLIADLVSKKEYTGGRGETDNTQG